MKLTISQEGSNPITIRTHDGGRSEEKLTPSRAYTTFANTLITLGGSSLCGLGILYPAISSILNHLTAIGTFNSGKEMLESEDLKGRVRQFEVKYGAENMPSLQEVETSSKTKNKSGAVAWFLGGQVSGDKIKDNIRTTDMILKKVGNVPVSIIKLKPYTGSLDVKQLVGIGVLIATAFVRKGKSIKSIPLCRGYLGKGGIVNESRECANIYWSEDGKAHSKKEILKYIKAIRSGESAGPIDANEAMNIIDELSV